MLKWAKCPFGMVEKADEPKGREISLLPRKMEGRGVGIAENLRDIFN